MSEYLYRNHPAMFKNNPIGFIVSILLVLAYGIGLVILFFWWLKVKGLLLSIDSKKSTMRKGIFSKQTNEVYHEDVRNIRVSQSFFQRMFGVGTLQISSAGQGNVEISISGIPDPEKAKKIINRYRNGNQNSNSNSTSSNTSTADELQKLAKLKEEGILSEAEFKAQKKKILE